MPSDANLQFEKLKVLIIPSSYLRGSFPHWLRGCNMLQLVDLSRNSLSQSIPFWVGKFANLFYLDLSENSFTGKVPEGLTQLQNLVYDNVSMDRIFPELPLFTTRQNGSGLQYNDIGSLPPTLNLSNNKLSGPISASFGDLIRLHVLDLSGNQLGGSIPDSLSGMKSLEILDLSHNNLSGEIPHSLVGLSFLSKFSVAFNHLHGEIPTAGQFMTFSYSSFQGNQDLCGMNYKPCAAEHTSPPPQPPTRSDEHMKIVGMNFGFGAVTGLLLSVTYCFACPPSYLQRHQGRRTRVTRNPHWR